MNTGAFVLLFSPLVAAAPQPILKTRVETSLPKTRVEPVRKDSQVGYFYHISEDPYESTNIYSDDSYADVLSYVQERTDYWADYVLAPQIPGDEDKKPYWKAAGGVVPWETSDYVPPRIPQLYEHKDAPNIVFVLVDDWGWNDVGFRSTYMSWTTPTIDNLAAEGISLENYYTAYSCIPARGAFLTGRYPIRLGLWESGEGAQLPLNETTLGQEMKSAGYRTYMIGKWHLGYSTNQHTPTMRGFDYYYGYWNGYVDYWTKEYGDYLDLHEGIELVTDESEIDATLHNGYLLQSKAEMVIKDHAANFADEPMFLYYAMQLIHGVWSAPQTFLDRCGSPTDDATDDYVQSVEYNYCALNVMLDEAIANLTCTLEQSGMGDNTILLIVSDNGGESTVVGNSYPWRGQKGSYYKGGMMGTAIIHSKLLPDDVRGTTYDGYMHVTGKHLAPH
jgi:arylsulfatase A-like enzyme